MKFATSSADLLAQLSVVSRVASTRSAVQALSGVQLNALSEGAELRATDMDVGLRVPLEATVEREGTVVLPARLLLDVVRSLPAGEATLELRPSEQDVEILSGSATFHIRTLRAEDFPPLPEPGGDTVVKVPAAAFVETINRVARSASRDETRPILTGILVSASGSELRMVATDSYRLSVKETRLEVPLEGGFEATVPARALQELARIAQAAGADELSVSVRANQIIFEVGGDVLSSRLIDGQFPNYRQLLPDAYEHELTLASGELTEVVRRISLMAQKNAPLRLRFSEGELDDLGADAGRRRGDPDAARAVRRRTIRDRLQPGVPARRPRELGGRRPRAQAHQPAAPRAHRVGRRQRLPLPHHADPAQRLGGPRAGDDRDASEAARLPQLRACGRGARRRA